MVTAVFDSPFIVKVHKNKKCVLFTDKVQDKKVKESIASQTSTYELDWNFIMKKVSMNFTTPIQNVVSASLAKGKTVLNLCPVFATWTREITAPKAILDVVPEKKERFKGAHIIGWIIAIFALSLFIGAVVLGVWDGVKNDFGFPAFFVRFLIMLYGMEIYDILFFDWVLLSHSNFFPHFYPEVKDVVGPHLFGYNKKTHIMHFIIYIPICAVAAWICTIF